MEIRSVKGSDYYGISPLINPRWVLKWKREIHSLMVFQYTLTMTDIIKIEFYS
ncbi:hypothetical protein [Peribacillus frigoritolerans]|uniref:hypothetical protein n=1 Tax=Peribacillus frigoritolerans TaxID=450367 RepID=UPI0013A5CE60